MAADGLIAIGKLVRRYKHCSSEVGQFEKRGRGWGVGGESIETRLKYE
jgi:hypothetical protein